MWPGFDSPTQRHMWAEFVGSLLCSERFFSGYSGFPPSPQKPKFDLIWFDLCWVKLIWFHLLWFTKGIPSIGITSGISCSWYWTNKVLLLLLLVTLCWVTCNGVGDETASTPRTGSGLNQSTYKPWRTLYVHCFSFLSLGSIEAAVQSFAQVRPYVSFELWLFYSYLKGLCHEDFAVCRSRLIKYFFKTKPLL